VLCRLISRAERIGGNKKGRGKGGEREKRTGGEEVKGEGKSSCVPTEVSQKSALMSVAQRNRSL